jgi:hypothetical protein
MLHRLVVILVLAVFSGCAPGARDECSAERLLVDPDNCGSCGLACAGGEGCVAGACLVGACSWSETQACYSADPGTIGVGSCHEGVATCGTDGAWGPCEDDRTPHAETCINALDEDCDGLVDENPDVDGDGYGTCDGDCCEGSECSDPLLVNPGAYDQAGNNVDDDCDGAVDNELVGCDAGLASNAMEAIDYARAMDLCNTATEASRRWGVVSAEFSLADGTGYPSYLAHSIRDGFGTALVPFAGSKLAVFSTGVAADTNDTDPDFQPRSSVAVGASSDPPLDWLAANGGAMPNLPACPEPLDDLSHDPILLTLRVRVPTNARSFSMKVNFFTHEYPEYICSEFNDFFVVLLDSTYAGSPGNPIDKNLAMYEASSGQRYPIGANLAFDNTGLFRVCQNGPAGCLGTAPFDHTACTSSDDLVDTGFDWTTSSEQCVVGPSVQTGGGTGWLTTSGNVVGGELMTLRIAIWDTSDAGFDSTALVDDFHWSVDLAEPGTVVE